MIETRIEDKVSKVQHEAYRLTIQPRSEGWYYDHPIDIELPEGDLFVGYIRYRVMYGRAGKELKYSLEGKKELLIRRKAEGGFMITWHNARQDNAA